MRSGRLITPEALLMVLASRSGWWTRPELIRAINASGAALVGNEDWPDGIYPVLGRLVAAHTVEWDRQSSKFRAITLEAVFREEDTLP